MTALTDLFKTLDLAPESEARSIRWQKYGDKYRVTVEVGGTVVTCTRHTLEAALEAAMNAYITETRAPQ